MHAATLGASFMRAHLCTFFLARLLGLLFNLPARQHHSGKDSFLPSTWELRIRVLLIIPLCFFLPQQPAFVEACHVFPVEAQGPRSVK